MVRFKPIILSTARFENAWSFTSKAHRFYGIFLCTGVTVPFCAEVFAVWGIQK
jgi:hypothetical protein